MNFIARDKTIIALPPNETHIDKEGYAVKASSGNAALLAADTDVPLGVILEGGPTTGKSSIALCGGNMGTVRVKLDATPGTVNVGTKLQSLNGGTWKADAGSGARVLAAIALEAGSAGEYLSALLVPPVSIAS